MLKKFEVKNFKNFQDKIIIDFSKVGGYQFNPECITQDMIGKMLIYGKNATGKTNLGRAVIDIKKVLLPSMSPALDEDSTFLNADSTEEYAEFNYNFRFGKDEIQYCYRKKDANSLNYEKLHINGEEYFSAHIFDGGMVLSPSENLLNQNVNLDMYTEAYRQIDESRQIRVIPFLRWLVSNTTLPEDSAIMKLYDYVKGMHFITLKNRASRGLLHGVFKTLENNDNLKDFESFLNTMGVKCELELQRLPDDTIELYFRHRKKVNFLQTASSGTLALFDIYRMLKASEDITFMYLDEFDAFYHYEMSENIMTFLKKKYSDSQVVMTTHNTNLMTNQIMRPDCLFILSTQGRLTPLCNATKRELREGHNLEKLYKSGEFEKYE